MKAGPWRLGSEFRNGFGRRVEVRAGPRSLDRVIATAISKALKEDSRSREELADDLSVFTGERITKFMLDAYASPARPEHSIPAHRLLMILHMTGRWDLLDQILADFGKHVLTESDLDTFKIGLLTEQKANAEAIIQQLLHRG